MVSETSYSAAEDAALLGGELSDGPVFGMTLPVPQDLVPAQAGSAVVKAKGNGAGKAPPHLATLSLSEVPSARESSAP